MLNKIKEQINYYYKNSNKMQIEELLRMQDVLSGNSYYLAELYSETYINYLDKIYKTKTKKIKWFLSKKSEKIQDKLLTDKLAEKFAEDESLIEWSEELFIEWEKERYRILLQQINQVLNAIMQRLSYLKSEKKTLSHNN